MNKQIVVGKVLGCPGEPHCYRYMHILPYKMVSGDSRLLQEHPSGLHRQVTDDTTEAEKGGLLSFRFHAIVLVPCHPLLFECYPFRAIFCIVIYSAISSNILPSKLNRSCGIKKSFVFPVITEENTSINHFIFRRH